MSMNECQPVVCVTLLRTSIADVGFAGLRQFEIAIEIHKYASHKNQINSLKCNLVCSTNMTLG